jgi:uncharacterized protein YcfL
MKHLLLIAGLAMFGCSSEPDQEDEDSVLLDSTTAPIEKAQAVEDMLLESKDRIDESVDEADE